MAGSGSKLSMSAECILTIIKSLHVVSLSLKTNTQPENI